MTAAGMRKRRSFKRCPYKVKRSLGEMEATRSAYTKCLTSAGQAETNRAIPLIWDEYPSPGALPQAGIG